MGLTWITGVLDVPASGFERSVRFWTSVTGSSPAASRGSGQDVSSDEFATLEPDAGDPYLRVQRVDHGPGGMHLDLHVDSVEETSGHARDLGASLIDTRPHMMILRSPVGVPFCVVGSSGEQHRPPAVLWEDGHRSVVDQISVDVSPSTYFDEAAFWTALTGWERRSGAMPEFEHLARPAGMPFRLLLQQLSEEVAGGGRMHLDLASDDVVAETSRHVDLGASVIRITRYWTTLVDPLGMHYCVTARDPGTGVL